MRAAEKIELALVAIVAIALRLVAPVLPGHIAFGRLLLAASALLLFQSLIRDLWLLAKARREASTSAPRIARCMCVESTVGITGIAIGLVLFAWGIGSPVSMGQWGWSALAILSLGAGFLIKDYVMELNPLRFRRDKDHVNIIVRWKW